MRPSGPLVLYTPIGFIYNSADSVDRETSCREIGVYKTNQSALKLHADKAFKRILVGTLRAVERADIFLLAVFADV